MKIGYVLKKFPRLSETFILSEILALEAAGIEVEVFSLKPPDDETRHGSFDCLVAPITVVEPLAPRSIFRHLEALSKQRDADSRRELSYLYSRLDADNPLLPRALKFAVPLNDLVRERGITHMHAHFATISTATAAEVHYRTGIPFSFTMHAKDIYRRGVDFERLSGWLHHAEFAVTVCEANAEWLRARCAPESCERLRVHYNGIDLTRWTPEATASRERLFIGVGRLVEKKGFEDYLRACAALRDTGREFKAILIGTGDDEEALRDLRAELGLENILDMPGALAQEKVRELMNRACLLVAPCRIGDDGNRDALPTVALEALAMELPCLTTPVGGIPEIVESGKHGWIVEPGNLDRFVSIMTNVLDNPDEARKCGVAGRVRAEERFDAARQIAQLSEWFRFSSDAGRARESGKPIATAPIA